MAEKIIKDCPFCGVIINLDDYPDSEYIEHPKNDCALSELHCPLEKWNNRPRQESLLRALKSTIKWIEPTDVSDEKAWRQPVFTDF